MSAANIPIHRGHITVATLRDLDEIDLRAFTDVILVDGDEDADLPAAVLMPYGTYVLWLETVNLARSFVRDMPTSLDIERALQSANAVQSQPANERSEEHQNKEIVTGEQS